MGFSGGVNALCRATPERIRAYFLTQFYEMQQGYNNKCSSSGSDKQTKNSGERTRTKSNCIYFLFLCGKKTGRKRQGEIDYESGKKRNEKYTRLFHLKLKTRKRFPSDPINLSFPLDLRELPQVLLCSRSLH